MEKKEKKVFLSILSLLIIFVMLTGRVEQTESQEKYPTRAIDLIVPFTPGGSQDLWTRLVADFLGKKWNVPINVINKGGGASVPGNLEVYKAAPDGYTLLADSKSSCSFLELSIKDLPFKVMDRTFIASIAVAPAVFMCSTKYPWKNLKDLEVEAKKDPANFTWASLGAGAAEYVQRQFFKAIGVDIAKTKPVITRGMGEANQLVAGGHIKMGTAAAASAHSFAKGGLVRPLAITCFRMPDLFPDLATTGEQGYPTIDSIWWFGFSGPPKLPSHIVNQWEETLQEILKDAKFISRMKDSGGIISYRNSSEIREYVRKEMERAAELFGVK